jgi:pyroglutamyl-peptidase
MSEKTLLLTGFGAFPGVVVNPTERIATALQGWRTPGWHVQVAVLPVAWQRARADVAALVAARDPALIVHLGVAGEAQTLRLEARAVNVLQFRVPDVDGLQPQDGAVVPDAPAEHATDLDVDALVAQLLQQGVAVERSTDAGLYVCNATYFSSLHAFGGHRVLFVHVPPISAAWPLPRLLGDVTALLRLLTA